MTRRPYPSETETYEPQSLAPHNDRISFCGDSDVRPRRVRVTVSNDVPDVTGFAENPGFLDMQGLNLKLKAHSRVFQEVPGHHFSRDELMDLVAFAEGN